VRQSHFRAGLLWLCASISIKQSWYAFRTALLHRYRCSSRCCLHRLKNSFLGMSVGFFRALKPRLTSKSSTPTSDLAATIISFSLMKHCSSSSSELDASTWVNSWFCGTTYVVGDANITSSGRTLAGDRATVTFDGDRIPASTSLSATATVHHTVGANNLQKITISMKTTWLSSSW
jgi:hypothetical protein